MVGRYVYDSFEGDYLATIGTDIHVKKIHIDDVLVKLVIWDIAGQDSFAQLRKAYYQNAAGAFFVFDRTRPETLDRIDDWISTLYSVTSTIPVVLVENKCDLKSKTSKDLINGIVNKYAFDYVQTSAKEDTNVEQAFMRLTKRILDKAREKEMPTA